MHYHPAAQRFLFSLTISVYMPELFWQKRTGLRKLKNSTGKTTIQKESYDKTPHVSNHQRNGHSADRHHLRLQHEVTDSTFSGNNA